MAALGHVRTEPTGPYRKNTKAHTVTTPCKQPPNSLHSDQSNQHALEQVYRGCNSDTIKCVASVGLTHQSQWVLLKLSQSS